MCIRDRGGTVLSVNADQLGTTVTYLGYILLGLGFVLALISKKSRFHMLIQRLKQYSSVAGFILILLVINMGTASAENAELTPIPRIEKNYFGRFFPLMDSGAGWPH
eukprot:TRINITY_DN20126_c0_g1_i1.p2 TRINITY_DN20126_c0_g1~~TRINITY_DN20126_c0_g1_i1.p2  ORF type:complete len:107 (+),score=7.23 TRINITY_DN20126_c0_g1_i1:85-405(+)